MSHPVSKKVEKRIAYYDRAERMTPVLGTRAGRGIYIVRTRDKNVGRSLFANEGRGEMQVLLRTVMVLEALLGSEAIEGKTFVDIGANIGTTTVPAVLDHGFARAVALEPEEENHRTLRLNVVLNELEDRVVTLRQAGSNENGTAELVVDLDQGGKHWIATDDEKKSRLRETDDVIEVETVTLDALAEAAVLDPDLVGLVWMDAQAHEGHILEGAGELTSRGVPIVLEWDPKGLDKRGDRGKIQEVAARDYTHFAGMRADRSGDGPKFSLRPVGELADYAERFLDPARPENYTDMLLLRLADDQVPEEELSELLEQGAAARREADPAENERVSLRVAARRRKKARQTKAKRVKAKAKRANVRAERANLRAERTEQKQTRREIADGEPDAPED